MQQLELHFCGRLAIYNFCLVICSNFSNNLLGCFVILIGSTMIIIQPFSVQFSRYLSRIRKALPTTGMESNEEREWERERRRRSAEEFQGFLCVLKNTGCNLCYLERAALDLVLGPPPFIATATNCLRSQTVTSC